MKSSNFIKIVISSIITLSFTACGGGGGETINSDNTILYKGQFIDSPVEGLNILCVSNNKMVTTDQNGFFECPANSKIKFMLGDIIFNINDIILDRDGKIYSPYDITGSDIDASIKIAQLLQTLDIDNNPNNGISLDSGKVEELSVSLKDATFIYGSDNNTFESSVSSVIGESVVSYDQAKSHLDQTLNGDDWVDDSDNSDIGDDGSDIDNGNSTGNMGSDNNSSGDIDIGDNTDSNDSSIDNNGTIDSGTDNNGTIDTGTDNNGTIDSGTDDNGTIDSGTDNNSTIDTGTDNNNTNVDNNDTVDSGTDNNSTINDIELPPTLPIIF